MMRSPLVKHSAWLTLARLWSLAAMGLFTILVARELGSRGFGEYAFMAALILVGNLLTTFGTDMVLIREIARDGRLDRLPAALAFQLLVSGVFVAAVLIAAPFLSFLSPEGLLAVRIYSFSLIPLAVYSVVTIALRGRQEMGAYALLGALLATSQLGAGMALVLQGGGLALLAWLLLAAQILSAFIAVLLCLWRLPDIRQAGSVSRRAILSLVRASASVAWLSAANALYQRLSLILLPFLIGAFQTGFFSASLRLVEMAKVGHIAAFTALYPMMAKGRQPNSEPLKSYRLPWLVLLGAAALASLALAWLAEPLVFWLLGAEYLPAVPLLRVLAWVLIPYTVNTFLSLAFLAQNDERAVTAAVLSGLVGLGVLVVWGSQVAGSAGAAWAVVSAEAFQAVILIWFAVRRKGQAAMEPEGVHGIPDLP